jgi:RNA ligase (TIGR02306 family)
MAKKDGENVYWQINKKYDIIERLSHLSGNYAVQGEICGPGIQKNRLGLTEMELFVFNIFDVDNAKYLDFVDFKQFCADFGLRTVQFLDEHFLFDHTVEQLLEMARGKYEGTKNDREGIVIRPLVNVFSHSLQDRLSVKVINNDYLLKED